MLTNRFNPLFLLIAALVIGAGLLLLFWKGNNPKLTEADSSYKAGEQATTIAEREKAFNQALTLYHQLEEKHQPEFGSGKLYFNLANTYFQLGQYPLALLYYHKASALMPREERVTFNLKMAKEKLGLVDETKPSAFERIFFFHTKLSLPERLEIFFWLSLIVLACCSYLIWNKKKWVKNALIVSFSLWVLMLLSLCYTRYISPLEGLIVNPTALYRDAGFQYEKVTENPVMPGSKVEILDVLPNRKWLKITTNDGQMGYVPQESIRRI